MVKCSVDDKLSVSVMMHVDRLKHHQYLIDKLGEDTFFSIDDGSMGIWKNCRTAWGYALTEDAKKFHCVIQDDAIIGKDFYEEANKVLNEDALYIFYVGRPKVAKKIARIKAKGKPVLMPYDRILNEVAICMPSKWVGDMINYCDSKRASTDRYINKWAQERGHKIYYVLPSLVDHRDEESLHDLNNGNYARVANWFIGE
jgi:hypothetical protein